MATFVFFNSILLLRHKTCEQSIRGMLLVNYIHICVNVCYNVNEQLPRNTTQMVHQTTGDIFILKTYICNLTIVMALARKIRTNRRAMRTNK